MNVININTDYIKLGQFLKLSGIASSGVEAKIYIIDGEVKVNGEIEKRRGRKLYDLDIIEYNNKKYKVKMKV